MMWSLSRNHRKAIVPAIMVTRPESLSNPGMSSRLTFRRMMKRVKNMEAIGRTWVYMSVWRMLWRSNRKRDMSKAMAKMPGTQLR